MLLWKLLHILTVFLAFGLALGSELILHKIAHSRDVRAIRTAFGLAKPLAVAVPVLFTLGLVFGIITAIAGSFNLLAPWLLLSYVLFIAGMALGGAVGARWQQEMAAAAVQSPDEAPSTELAQLIGDRRAGLALWGNVLVVSLIVVLMVLKPFS